MKANHFATPSSTEDLSASTTVIQVTAPDHRDRGTPRLPLISADGSFLRRDCLNVILNHLG